MGRGVAAVLCLVGVVIVVIGYRMGTGAGLATMAGGVAVIWFVVQATAWRIPTIGEVWDRPPSDDGFEMPADLRAQDPSIVMDQRWANSLDDLRP